jgi:hypothetical protein
MDLYEADQQMEDLVQIVEEQGTIPGMYYEYTAKTTKTVCCHRVVRHKKTFKK